MEQARYGSADELLVDIVEPSGRLIASFVSVVEAVRYACLLHEPGYTLHLRRRTDGELRAVEPAGRLAPTEAWANGAPDASPIES